MSSTMSLKVNETFNHSFEPRVIKNSRKTILTISELTKSYNSSRNVLNKVSLEIKSGELIGIIGKSGAGKSTLLHCINGSKKTNSGSILHHQNNGSVKDITKYNSKNIRSWKRCCGTIYQDFCLVPRLDVITNVLMGRLGYESNFKTLFKIFKNKDKEKAIELLDWLKILPHALQRAENLSGGQQQRVAICRALMQEPDILLADEPVASLDPKNTHKIMDALTKVSHRGISVIVNLHSIELVKQYCTRVIGLSQGSVVFDGSPNNLTSNDLDNIYNDETTL